MAKSGYRGGGSNLTTFLCPSACDYQILIVFDTFSTQKYVILGQKSMKTQQKMFPVPLFYRSPPPNGGQKRLAKRCE
jgi:hypothetical protein